jgi:hypothetical protein
VAVSVVVWGLVVRLALSLRRGLDTGLVVAAVVAMTLVSAFEAMISAGRHGQSALLQSSLGWFVALLLEALRALSFGYAARTAQAASAGDAEIGPLDAAAAAWAWAWAWSLVGALVGPGVAFQVPAAGMLAAALACLVHIHALAVRGATEGEPAQVRAGARPPAPRIRGRSAPPRPGGRALRAGAALRAAHHDAQPRDDGHLQGQPPTWL